MKYIRIITLLVCLAMLCACDVGVSAEITPPSTSPTDSVVHETQPESSEVTTEPTVPETTEPPHEHSYTKTVNSATCTEIGYSTYTCTCGDNYTADETPAVGHQMGDWKTTEASTWFTAGKQQRKCVRCDTTELGTAAKKTIAKSGTIKVPASKNILDYLVEPQPEDFGKYYDNAMLLYNAFLTQQEDWCYLFFSEETYDLELKEWKKLKSTFEKKCFQDCGISIYIESFSTGAFPEGAGLTRINLKVRDAQELYTRCCGVIQEMGLYTGMSQYEAVLTMNEWMRKNIKYELQHWNPLDVIETGKAQCAGYAYLFEYLCKYTGINATYVTGCVGHDDGPCQYGCHAWNRVKLAGKWYYLDICWNDSDKPNRYFLTEELWSGRVVMSDSYTA